MRIPAGIFMQLKIVFVKVRFFRGSLEKCLYFVLGSKIINERLQMKWTLLSACTSSQILLHALSVSLELGTVEKL